MEKHRFYLITPISPTRQEFALKELAPEVGFEPTAKRLTAARSTTELLGNPMRLNIITSCPTGHNS